MPRSGPPCISAEQLKSHNRTFAPSMGTELLYKEVQKVISTDPSGHVYGDETGGSGLIWVLPAGRIPVGPPEAPPGIKGCGQEDLQ